MANILFVVVFIVLALLTVLNFPEVRFRRTFGIWSSSSQAKERVFSRLERGRSRLTATKDIVALAKVLKERFEREAEKLNSVEASDALMVTQNLIEWVEDYFADRNRYQEEVWLAEKFGYQITA